MDEETTSEESADGQQSLFDMQGTPKFSPVEAQHIALWCMLAMAVAHHYKSGRQPEEIHGWVDDVVASGMPPESVPGWMFVLALAVDLLQKQFSYEPEMIHQVVDANVMQVQQLVRGS